MSSAPWKRYCFGCVFCRIQSHERYADMGKCDRKGSEKNFAGIDIEKDEEACKLYQN
jgi:hypothetical protein